jgi:hypothetical protein
VSYHQLATARSNFTSILNSAGTDPLLLKHKSVEIKKVLHYDKSQSTVSLHQVKMDQRSSVRQVVNDTHIVTYFATNLAVTFIRRSTAEGLECSIRPVFGPDTSFTDPATARVHLIEGEISLLLHYTGQQTAVTAYVVQNNKIGAPIVLGMDSFLALQGRLLSRYGDEEMNPHYPIPGEEDLTAPQPIYFTGLTVSMASLA